MWRSTFFFFVLLALTADVARADPLRVFATVPDLAALVQVVGGDRVTTFSAVSGTEDPHFAEAKPSYIKELSQADAYIEVGMELEIGYSDNLLRNARNAKVLPGRPGHIVASEVIVPLDVPTGLVSRAMGDVHGFGNPHFLVDPLSALAVAELIRVRLSEIRPVDAAYFDTRARDFRAELGKRLVGARLHEKYDGTKLALLAQQGRLIAFLEQQGDRADLDGWFGMLAPHQGAKAVDDHPIWPYFARTFGIEIVGHLEPRPGIQPTTAHLKQLVERMKAEQVGVILQSAYYDPRHARFVAEATGASIAKLAHQVGALPDTSTYLDMVDVNVRALAQALGTRRS
jgi:ABC-type Zn uptake system ZnuABC Zn-binding protein ZnuA